MRCKFLLAAILFSCACPVLLRGAEPTDDADHTATVLARRALGEAIAR